MELRSLYYFLTVAREENITRAAEKLHLTQPTLSRQLKQLEDELGKQLLVRGKRKIQLTDAGMLLRRRAEEILNLVQIAEKDLQSDEDTIEGQINIGSAECGASTTLLPEVIRSFSLQYPNVTYDLYTGNADLIKEELDKGLVDIGLLLEPVDIEKYDFIRLPHKERWGLLVNKNSELAEKKQIEAMDLKDIPLINTKREIVQNEIASWYHGRYEDLNIVATHNLLSNSVALVANGVGNIITIEGAYNNHINKDVIFIPLYPELFTGMVLVWKKHYALSPAVSKFLDTFYHSLDV